MPGLEMTPSPESSNALTRMSGMITLDNKDFGPWEKMFIFNVFLDAEFECFQNFSITLTFCVETMWPHTPTYVCHWGPVGGSLDMM